MNAGSKQAVDLTDESIKFIVPTKDVSHSILEPMNIKPLKLPQYVIDDMKKQYDEVCVNDFKDIYHMPEDERKKSMRFYEAFRDMRMCKIKHRTLDTYVTSCRIMMKCLSTIAGQVEDDWIDTKEGFITKVLSGKIKVVGLKIPKFIGKGKKDINWKLVTEYILDESRDPSDLSKKPNEQFWEVVTEDDLKELESQLGCDPIEYFNKYSRNITEEELEDIDVLFDDLTEMNVAIPLTKKEQKNILRRKNGKIFLMCIKDMKKSQGDNRFSSSFAYELTQDSFSQIKVMDEKRLKLNGVPKFEGNALSSDDVDKYIYELEEYERTHVKVERNGKWVTIEDADEIDLKEALEQNGMDIRKFYNYSQEKKKLKKKRERDLKKIKRIKKNLAQAQNKYDKKHGDKGVSSKKKKKSKSAKKSEKRLDRGFDDGFKAYQKQMEGWDD